MVDRERLSEIAGRAAWLSHYDDDPAPGIEEALASQMGKDALAALEAAGYAWYRVEDAKFAYQTSALARTYAVTVDPDEADVLLVPVGGEG